MNIDIFLKDNPSLESRLGFYFSYMTVFFPKSEEIMRDAIFQRYGNAVIDDIDKCEMLNYALSVVEVVAPLIFTEARDNLFKGMPGYEFDESANLVIQDREGT